jgi:hypothetical protein
MNSILGEFLYRTHVMLAFSSRNSSGMDRTTFYHRDARMEAFVRMKKIDVDS